VTIESLPDAQKKARDDARNRGLVALVGTLAACVIAFLVMRGCIDGPPAEACKTNGDCDGLLGVECLRAPTSTYCTHRCEKNEDCDPGFHCDSPPWEKGATRALCLKDIPPAK